MLRLMYISTASPKFDPAMIQPLVDRASENNARLGITGVLAFNGRNFAQVLEGDEAVVECLLTSITDDYRHDGLVVVRRKNIESRAFGDWSMRRVDGLDFGELVNAMAD